VPSVGVVIAFDVIEDGEFTPIIDRHYTLNKTVEAYTCVESGKKVGNVMLFGEDPTPSYTLNRMKIGMTRLKAKKNA
jgi:hypothetical protein